MPKFSIYGHAFEFSDRYAEGHAVTANEATALNNLMGELIGHRIRAMLSDKHGFQKGTAPSDHPEAIAEAEALVVSEAAEFEFGAGRGSGTRAPSAMSELDKLAKKFAEDAVKAKMRQEGYTKIGKADGSNDNEAGVYPRARYNEVVAKVMVLESIQTKAKKALAAASKTEAEDFGL